MINSLVVRKGTDPAKLHRASRAAQYVRMSTELQRYSIQNQAAAIAAYAQDKNLTIIRTYIDEGRSGLRLKGRTGLVELIDDVRSGCADFDYLLVYDVSRWGRFQDVDESAHYEFICKEGGVRVVYCAEQFDNDGSLLSSIIKNIKRVMAAEYSRELSVKVHAGLCKLASLGYRAGGPTTYGLRRELVDESLHPKGLLRKGEYKSLKSDRVLVQAGSNEENRTVRWIFDQFVEERKCDAEIARTLNQAQVNNHHGRPWTPLMIHNVLKNENYIGKVVYNRTSKQLGQKLRSNPPEQWVRATGAIKPIVDEDVFERARRIMADRYIAISEDEMLKRLRTALARRGRLTTRIINSTPGLPCSDSYVDHFGSLRKAYALVGYTASRDCDWFDCRDNSSAILAQNREHIRVALQKLQTEGGTKVIPNEFGATLNGKLYLSFVLARRATNVDPKHVPFWRAHTYRIPSGLLAVGRLNDENRSIQDYALIPYCQGRATYLRLSDVALPRLRGLRFATLDELIHEVGKRTAASRRSARTRPAPSMQLTKSGRPRTKNVHARR
ncbi:recombinase family protein [Bradyrhizobium sp. CIR3A]|uniref:recombinase family protein n=1 Tax=Bradyrhizobium sp. CIR3A TaxID=2663838 RepID=UPI001605B21C|nr:recombinase family protein [Bradyrhizobium sp. CIR3A]MBB4257307.1 DNA invertase Pin-like site-specific DNA recombinase [Bradyrhizobium sp. CIR3A]